MFPLKIFVDMFRSQMIENRHLDRVKVRLRIKCDCGSCAVGMKENSIQMRTSWELSAASMDVSYPLNVREPTNKLP